MIYTKSYTDGNYRLVPGFDVPVRLPDKPALNDFMNYGKDIEDQVYEYTPVPSDILRWKKKDRDKFVEEMWHRRINGEWWLIGGKEIYINGYLWFFLNAWTPEIGGRPLFRIEAVDYYDVAEHIIDDDKSYGAQIIKGRRLGDTEKTLCLGYDLCTRYRHSWFGMQNIVDTDAKENYERITVAHSNMPFYFKPKSKGADDAAKGIRFIFPHDELEGQDVETKPLYSKIDYRATVYKAYDGKRLRFYHLDEYGKIPKKSMPVVRQWNVVKQCLSLNQETRIVGKAWFTTTVEDIMDGETVAVCQEMWDQSNPKERQANGRTMSGLYRYFRDFKLTAPVDKFGFHQEEEAIKNRKATIDGYRKKKDLQGLSDYIRKFPETVEEALEIPATDCVMYPALLDHQKGLINSFDKGIPVNNFIGASRYNLSWTGTPFNSPVKATPSETGKFEISQHPINPNARQLFSQEVAPGNKGLYAGGIDGYDHKEGTSEGGFAIFMPYNDLYEGDLDMIVNEEGMLIPSERGLMKTNRFVCTYRHREPDPDDFYMDCAMALYYYGCQALPERDKPGVINYMTRHGMKSYLSYKPSMFKLGSRNEVERGIKTTMQSISIWVGLLQTHLYNFAETYTHLNLVKDLRKFNGSNQKKCDLLVAAGLAMMLAHQEFVLTTRKKQNNNRHQSIPA